MKQQVMIEIKSIIETDGDSDKIEITTRATRFVKDGVTYISYKETDQNGFDGNSVLIKAEGEKRVTVNRMGPERSQLIIEAGRRNICSYQTPHGAQTLGITGGRIRLLKDSLSFNYELDLNNVLMSKNQLFITVKECAK